MKRGQTIKKRNRGKRYLRNRLRNSYVLSRDFSSVEDAPNSFELIKAIVARAGKNAAAEAEVAGLPQTFARDDKIIRIHQSGEEEIIETAETAVVKSTSYYITYPPSTILYARKK